MDTSAEASTSAVAEVQTEVAPPALPESLKGKTDEEIDEVKQKVVTQREWSGASPPSNGMSADLMADLCCRFYYLFCYFL